MAAGMTAEIRFARETNPCELRVAEPTFMQCSRRNMGEVAGGIGFPHAIGRRILRSDTAAGAYWSVMAVVSGSAGMDAAGRARPAAPAVGAAGACWSVRAFVAGSAGMDAAGRSRPSLQALAAAGAGEGRSAVTRKPRVT